MLLFHLLFSVAPYVDAEAVSITVSNGNSITIEWDKRHIRGDGVAHYYEIWYKTRSEENYGTTARQEIGNDSRQHFTLRLRYWNTEYDVFIVLIFQTGNSGPQPGRPSDILRVQTGIFIHYELFLE